MKTCTKCGETKPLDEFGRYWKGAYECIKSSCRRCTSRDNARRLAERRTADPAFREAARRRARAYRAANRERFRERDREYYAAHREERLEFAHRYKSSLRGVAVRVRAQHRRALRRAEQRMEAM